MINTKQREYVSKNKDIIYSKNKEYREKNKEKLTESSKLYRENNKEVISKRRRLKYIAKFGEDNKSHGSYNITNAEKNRDKWINENIIFYKLKMTDIDGTVFYKIGLTVNLKNRLRHIPYKCEIVKEINVDKYKGTYMERYCLEEHKNRTYVPITHFAGYSECYK